MKTNLTAVHLEGTSLGRTRVSLGLAQQMQRCCCWLGGVQLYPQPVSHAEPRMLYRRESLYIIYFCIWSRRGGNTPHMGFVAPTISYQSRKVLIAPNGVFMLHLRVKNLVLSRSKFSKAFTINAQFLAVPFGSSATDWLIVGIFLTALRSELRNKLKYLCFRHWKTASMSNL